MKYKIHFLPMDKVIEAEKGDNLLKIAASNNVLINGSCAGKGTCGKCKVLIEDEQSNSFYELSSREKQLLSKKEIEEGYRLACQIEICSSLVITLPAYHDGSDRKKRLNQLPDHFIPDEWAKNSSLQDPSASSYGVAVDIGTTTIVLMLWDLIHSQLIDTEAATNPQINHGADVISRITYCMEEPDNTRKMQQKVINCINQMIKSLAKKNQIDINHIVDMTVVGNTTMSHLFLGLNPEGLARFPFAPSFYEGVSKNASKLGISINPRAEVYVMPNIAGHVGSDITGVMLASDIFSLSGNTVIIDIGTNGEIMAAVDGKVKACSTAAGPAFEGTGIMCGMRAANGAIERVSIGDDLTIKVIGDVEPIGICGSGIIDVAAALLQAGIISREGNFISPEEAKEIHLSESIISRIYESDEYNPGFILGINKKGEKIVITQKDIREIQLAKSAILSGIKTLLDKFGIQEKDIDRVLVAGAFGSYIDKKSAVSMGLLPDIDIDKIQSIGNAAGTGASMALLSRVCRNQAQLQTKQIEHVELSQDMDFQKYYIDCMFFPQTGNNEERS